MIWLVVWLIWLVYSINPLFFFSCFWILISTTAMNSRGCGLSVNALCCFRHISSSHGSELTWCCIMLPFPLFFPPNDIFSLVLIPLLPAACTYCIHWPNIFYIYTHIFFLFVCYWNVTTVGESMLENVIRHNTWKWERRLICLGVFLSVSECNFENTQMTWVFAMIQSTTFFICEIRTRCMQPFSNNPYEQKDVMTQGCLYLL